MKNINIPRPEFPEPMWERRDWKNLNGMWEFDFDFGDSAIDRKLFEKDEKLPLEILVPFCPESKLSGINHTDFIPAVCYRKKITLEEKDLNGRLFLHFGAVDYNAFVYVNGSLVCKHKGGYASFKSEITDFAKIGENTIFVIAKDDVRSGNQPRGKQSGSYDSAGCDYTRTTGIWQTVWLEKTPKSYIKSVKYYPDIHTSSLTVIGVTEGKGTLEIKALFSGKTVGEVKTECFGGAFIATLSLTETHLWEIGNGNLYDLEFVFGEDRVKSYFGLRNVRLDGMKFMLNDKSVFQRTVLDQGFYRDGIYTAPTEEDLIKDIKLSLDAGFNGARMHQKVFESRYIYNCDKMGYIVWGEFGSWGQNYLEPQATEIALNEWMQVVERDFNHPSIIGWCPVNESWGYVESRQKNCVISSLYNYTKIADVTRPVIDTSGCYHTVTDIFDIHDYDQNPEAFKEKYDHISNPELIKKALSSKDQTYGGEPVYISEYGGIKWDTEGNSGWGYGEAPKTEEEFLDRYKGLTDTLLDNPVIFGFCYTQLYDIEQELNGLYTYDRKPKFDMSYFKKVNSRKAKIEE